MLQSFWSSDFPAKPGPFEQHRVTDDGERTRCHGNDADHRVQQTHGGDGDGGDVVTPGPEHVLYDLAEGQPREFHRLHHLGEFAADQGDVRRLDGDIRAGADGDAHVGLLERRASLMPSPTMATCWP